MLQKAAESHTLYKTCCKKLEVFVSDKLLPAELISVSGWGVGGRAITILKSGIKNVHEY